MVHVLKIYVVSRSGIPEIRQVTINSNVLSSYSLLTEKIISTIPRLEGKNISLYWKDNEGDDISIIEDNDLAQAIANMEDILKIFVKISGSDESDRPAAYASDEAHNGVVCDGCSLKIFGYRYKCLQCPDFDLCSACNTAGKHPFHDMLKLATPVTVPRQWAFYSWKRFFKSIFGRDPNVEVIDHSNSQQCGYSKKKENADNDVKSNDIPSPLLFEKELQNLLSGKTVGNFCGLVNQILKPFGADLRVEVDVPENSAAQKADKETKDACNKEGFVTKKVQTEFNPEKKKIDANVDTTLLNGARPKIGTETNCGLFSHGNADSVNINADNASVQPSAPVTTSAKPSAPVTASAKPSAPVTASTKPSAPVTNEMDQSKDFFNLSNQESSTAADDWTVINAPQLFSCIGQCDASLNNNVEPSSIKATDNGFEDLSNLNPEVADALIKMRTMGFTNEGGWLLRLLEAKKGNIYQALDSLYPNQPNPY